MGTLRTFLSRVKPGPHKLPYEWANVVISPYLWGLQLHLQLVGAHLVLIHPIPKNKTHKCHQCNAGDDLKLIDFGLSKFWEPSKKMEMRVPRPRGSLMHGEGGEMPTRCFFCCYEKMSSGTEILGFLFKVIFVDFLPWQLTMKFLFGEYVLFFSINFN